MGGIANLNFVLEALKELFYLFITSSVNIVSSVYWPGGTISEKGLGGNANLNFGFEVIKDLFYFCIVTFVSRYSSVPGPDDTNHFKGINLSSDKS